MSQDSCSEEDFALTHSEQVVVQLQSFDLDKDTTFTSGKKDSNILCVFCSSGKLLTISSDACLPSMKVRGIALGVRISYLRIK